jgi:hypothetical protein
MGENPLGMKKSREPTTATARRKPNCHSRSNLTFLRPSGQVPDSVRSLKRRARAIIGFPGPLWPEVVAEGRRPPELRPQGGYGQLN